MVVDDGMFSLFRNYVRLYHPPQISRKECRGIGRSASGLLMWNFSCNALAVSASSFSLDGTRRVGPGLTDLPEVDPKSFRALYDLVHGGTDLHVWCSPVYSR